MLNLRWLVVLGAALTLGSCIDFQGEQLTYRYDRVRDTLRIFVVYEGIHAARKEGLESQGGPLNREEKKQLESVVKGQRAFFFDNWISEFDRARIEENLGKLKEERDLTEAPEQKKRLESNIAFWKAVLDSVRVQNGRFYLNAKGQLCGWQYVTISPVSRLVPLINAHAGRMAENIKSDLGSDRARQRLAEFARKGEWVKVDGNQIRIRFVLPYDEFAKRHRNVIEKKDPYNLVTQDTVLNYDEPIAEVIFGRLAQETTTLSRPAAGKPSGETIAHVKKEYGLVPMPDLNKLRDAFIRTGKIPGK